MSFALFNHNLPILEFSGDGSTEYPGTAQDITATNLFAGSVITQNRGPCGQDNGGTFFAAGANGHILLAEDTDNGELQFSDDFGSSWTTRTFSASYGNVEVVSIQYDEGNDRWWVATYDSVSRWLNIYYSENGGSSWTFFDGGASANHNYTSTMMLTSAGDIIVGSRRAANNYAYYRVYQNAPASTTYSEFADALYNSNSQYIFALDGYYLGLVHNGANWNALEYDAASIASAPTNYGSYLSVLNSFGAGEDAIAVIAYRGYTGTVVTYDKFTHGLPVSTLPTFTYDFGVDVRYCAAAFNDYAYMIYGSKLSDFTKLLFARSDQYTPENFSAAHTVTLSSARVNHVSYQSTQMKYLGGGKWLFAYIDSSQYARLDMFEYGVSGSTAFPTVGATSLSRAITRQQPDIFMRLDDAADSTTVVDTGSQGYTNSVVGSPTFETAGLVGDDGTALLFGSTTDEGIQIEEVPTPLNHAHVFVLSHDDTAAVRVLAGSQAEGYVIVLGSDHKLGVGLYDGGWTYTYGDDAIAADTATLCAVRIKGGVATIYVGNAYDTAAELDMPASATGYLTLGGLTDGEDSLTSCADGVTIDYYALIPAVTFDYADLVEANGGSYTGPTGSPQSDGAQFLLHGDESAASGPFPSRTVPGRNYYTFVNSVPGSPNKVSTEDASQSLVAGGKFSGGFYVPPFRPLEDDWSPWTAPYWSRKESHSSPASVSELVLGQGEFTFACWMKPAQASPVQLFSNCHVEKIGSQWWTYGGITVIYTQEPGDASMGRVVVAIHSAKGQASDLQCKMMFRNIPGYTTAAFTHFALSREVLPDGTTRWHVFLNGKRAGEPSVSNYTADAYPDAYIHEGGQVNLGRAVGTSADHLQITKFGGGLYFDDALLITGEALYTEDFTPPTGAYSLE